MSWLKIDDGFADNPKISALSDREFRVWTRVLCYCARYRDPTVDASTISAVKGLDSKKIGRYLELGLLDPHGDANAVHDWDEYAPKDPTGAIRQARWRRAHNEDRNASRNGSVTEDVTEDIPF